MAGYPIAGGSLSSQLGNGFNSADSVPSSSYPIAGGSLSSQIGSGLNSSSSVPDSSGSVSGKAGPAGNAGGGHRVPGVSTQGGFGGSGSDSSSPNYSLTDIMSYLEASMNSSADQADLNRAFNSAEAELSRKFQAEENQKNRDFTERMANTSYVRAVRDLQEAGLNPILAYQQGGASSPSAASSVSAAQASYNVGSGDTFSSILSAFASLANSTGGLVLLIDTILKNL